MQWIFASTFDFYRKREGRGRRGGTVRPQVGPFSSAALIIPPCGFYEPTAVWSRQQQTSVLASEPGEERLSFPLPFTIIDSTPRDGAGGGPERATI